MRTTGHVFVDVGEAVIHVISGRKPAEIIRNQDLQYLADWLAQQYTQPGPMRNLMQGMVLLNSGYTQKNALIRDPYVEQVLYSWQQAGDPDEDPCAFCGDYSAYRANRESLPLFTGRNIINFSPAGVAGLPVCGRCSIAMHSMPIGCAKSGKFLVAPFSTDVALMYGLVRENVHQLMQLLSMPDLEKLPGTAFERTYLVDMLVKWMARAERLTQQTVSLTGYCFTNSGANPDLAIYSLDTAVLRWLESLIHHDDVSIQQSWWQMVRMAQRSASKSNASRNLMYEALFDLPRSSRQFFNRFIHPQRNWHFASIYLEKIMLITQQDIQQIRLIGERFARYARERPAFVYDFARTHQFAPWRRVILNAADDCSKRFGYALISMDEFTQLFVPKEDAPFDWRLARDLITLIMIEARVTPDTESLFETKDISTEEID